MSAYPNVRFLTSANEVSLVNDVPGEIMLHPGLWGTVRFGL